MARERGRATSAPPAAQLLVLLFQRRHAVLHRVQPLRQHARLALPPRRARVAARRARGGLGLGRRGAVGLCLGRLEAPLQREVEPADLLLLAIQRRRAGIGALERRRELAAASRRGVALCLGGGGARLRLFKRAAQVLDSRNLGGGG
jgi:hypothetical protein